jgi:hypothetical protein
MPMNCFTSFSMDWNEGVSDWTARGREWTVKAYVAVTGVIFGVLALSHALRTIVEWPQSGLDAGFILIPAVGVVAAGLGLWAWRLLRSGRG